MRPQRIVILGNAGSGKSTLSRQLGAKLSYPVIHLDKLFWQPDWKKPKPDEFITKVNEAISSPQWICEGNYHRRTFGLRLPRADLVIWLNTPRTLCLIRVIFRSLRNQHRPDLPEGCREKLNAEFFAFLRYVWRFDRDVRPQIEDLRKTYGPNVVVVELRNQRQIDQFLANLV